MHSIERHYAHLSTSAPLLLGLPLLDPQRDTRKTLNLGLGNKHGFASRMQKRATEKYKSNLGRKRKRNENRENATCCPLVDISLEGLYFPENLEVFYVNQDAVNNSQLMLTQNAKISSHYNQIIALLIYYYQHIINLYGSLVPNHHNFLHFKANCNPLQRQVREASTSNIQCRYIFIQGDLY